MYDRTSLSHNTLKRWPSHKTTFLRNNSIACFSWRIFSFFIKTILSFVVTADWQITRQYGNLILFHFLLFFLLFSVPATFSTAPSAIGPSMSSSHACNFLSWFKFYIELFIFPWLFINIDVSQRLLITHRTTSKLYLEFYQTAVRFVMFFLYT